MFDRFYILKDFLNKDRDYLFLDIVFRCFQNIYNQTIVDQNFVDSYLCKYNNFSTVA